MHRTNIELDEKLVKEGMRLFNKKTKKELVERARRCVGDWKNLSMMRPSARRRNKKQISF